MSTIKQTDTKAHRVKQALKRLNSRNKIHLAVLKQMVTLATSGFGLVAALAWNNVIQELVNNHIKPFLPEGSSLISLLIYAILITTMAVIITYNLTQIVEKLESFGKEDKNE